MGARLHRLESVRAHLLEMNGDPEAARNAYVAAARRTPLIGYCPCESAGGDRLAVTAVGRRAQGIGATVAMIRFDDGISVVLHFNSDATDNPEAWWLFVLAIHDAAARS